MLGASTPSQARSRVLRACDKCSRSKQRCDGQLPCRRCAIRDDPCHYTKVVRKRGRHPRTDTIKDPPAQDRSRRLRPASQLGGQEPMEMSDGSPRDTTTPSSDQARELSQVPAGPNHDYPSQPEGSAPATDIPSHERVADPNGGIDPLRRQFPDNSMEGKTPRENQTSVSSLIDPAFRFDGLYSGSMDGHGGPGFEANQGIVTSGSVRHWLEKTPSLPSGGSLPGLHQILDGEAMSMRGDNMPRLQYRCLEPLLPRLRGILSAEEASEMLEIYFNEQRNSLFKSNSPYALTHVLHPSSILHATDPRPTSPTLLVVILFCVAQTADMKIFDPPGSRERIVVDLYRLSLDLIQPDDADNYFRTSDGWQFYPNGTSMAKPHPTPTRHVGGKSLLPDALGSTDIILAVAILTLVISGGHYKADSLRWLDKLIRLVRASGLSMEDQDIEPSPVPDGFFSSPYTYRRRVIAKEERRRLFWLVYCLDRHLALSFNLPLRIPEGTFCVRAPLPEQIWQSLDTADLDSLPTCPLGPSKRISGGGFFEYFLPLATILGHIIDLHHSRNHPVLGEFVSADAIHRIEAMISQRQQELAELDNQVRTFYDPIGKTSTVNAFTQQNNSGADAFKPSATRASPAESKLPLVKAYSTYLLHVFHILLHGKWDPISMIEEKDDWITSERFPTCASHALSATGVLSQILTFDPELTFMPYLFGIYLLQGSFIFLLFVDRMPELGPNRSVEEVCETIIRAHEVCVVTLDTTFQKNIRKVFRSMLHDAQQTGSHSWDEHKARRRELLSLYRWTPLANGLAY